MNRIFCEWGLNGIIENKDADVVIIVDVLSFSTCVDIAVSNQAWLYPYRYKDATADTYAKEKNALLAVKRGTVGYTFSPASLLTIKKMND